MFLKHTYIGDDEETFPRLTHVLYACCFTEYLRRLHLSDYEHVQRGKAEEWNETIDGAIDPRPDFESEKLLIGTNRTTDFFLLKNIWHYLNISQFILILKTRIEAVKF